MKVSIDPVWSVHYVYTDKTDAKVAYMRSVRAPDEMNVRIWVQKLCHTDVKKWGSLNIHRLMALDHNLAVPHIYDLEDRVEDEIRKKIKVIEKDAPDDTSSVQAVIPEFSLGNLPWAERFLVWPGRGLGTTKTSIKESFYDAAEGAYE